MVIAHKDTDGGVAARVLRVLLGEEDIHFFDYSDTRDAEWQQLLNGYEEDVYFTDLSLNPGELEWARKGKPGKWVWIDHHQDKGFDPEGVFDDTLVDAEGDFCGAELTYTYLKGDDSALEEWLQYAHDRDFLTKQNWEIVFPLSLLSRVDVSTIALADGSPEEVLEQFEDVWRPSLEVYEEQLQGAKENGKLFDGPVPVFVAFSNADFDSDIADQLVEDGVCDAEIIVVMVEESPEEEQAKVGLYTKGEDVDLSKIADEVFGGGGHKKASGGKIAPGTPAEEIAALIFESLDSDETIVKEGAASLPNPVRSQMDYDEWLVLVDSIRGDSSMEKKLRKKTGRRSTKPQKCEYCDSAATKSLIWANGKGYVPVCEKHIARGKKEVSVEFIRDIPQRKKKKKSSLVRVGAYPDHPDEKVLSSMTELDVYEHWMNVKDEVLTFVNGRNVMYVIMLPDDSLIYKRKDAEGNPLKLTPMNYEDQVSGRLVEVHVEISDETDFIYVDLDPKEGFPPSALIEISKVLQSYFSEMPEVADVKIFESGKKGRHLHIKLEEVTEIDQARAWLRKKLENFAEGDMRLTTALTSEKGTMRLDYTLNHRRGTVRVPGSLTSTGGMKKEAQLKQRVEDLGLEVGVRFTDAEIKGLTYYLEEHGIRKRDIQLQSADASEYIRESLRDYISTSKLKRRRPFRRPTPPVRVKSPPVQAPISPIPIPVPKRPEPTVPATVVPAPATPTTTTPKLAPVKPERTKPEPIVSVPRRTKSMRVPLILGSELPKGLQSGKSFWPDWESFFDPNSTQNQGRHRLVDPHILTDYHTRHQWRGISMPGVSFIVGLNKADESRVQSVRFDKQAWSEDEAEEWFGEARVKITARAVRAQNQPVMQPDSAFAAGRGDEPRGPYRPAGRKSRQLGAEPGEDDMAGAWWELLLDELAPSVNRRKRYRKLMDEDTRAYSFDLAP